MVKRSDLKSKLTATLEQEDAKVKERFEKADNIFVKPQDPIKIDTKVANSDINATAARFPVSLKVTSEENNKIEEMLLMAAQRGARLSKSDFLRSALHMLLDMQPSDKSQLIDSIIESKRSDSKP
tara:strand:- start:837 stop:1211 length:375 start_codon:yes stop_codon:yes gene_type:complete